MNFVYNIANFQHWYLNALHHVQASTSIPIITIDGPSGSGKGTLASLIASHYGFHLLDSGALYRLLALAAEPIANQLTGDINTTTEQALAQIAKSLNIEFKSINGKATQVLLNGQDVSLAIRAENIGLRASKIATIACVRDALLDRQRAFATQPGLVADGRDMGTVVFKQAPIKFYLTASAQARAKRRMAQLQQRTIDGILGGALAQADVPDHSDTYATILNDIITRDKRDSERTVAPLVPATDAVLIDASEMTIDAVLTTMQQHIDAYLRH